MLSGLQPPLIRLDSLRLAVVCLLALTPALLLTPSAPPRLGSYYLALGDSLATGASTSDTVLDPTCQSPDAVGYVCDFYRYLRKINPSLQLENLAVGGVDSCVLVHGFGAGSPCADPLMYYDTPSQLQEAIQFLRAHPNAVNPITVDVGGNDLMEIVHDGPPSVGEVAGRFFRVLQAYRANLHTALVALHAAAPRAEIIVMTHYNPVGGLPGKELPLTWKVAAAAAIGILNTIVRQDAASVNAVVADVGGAFSRAPNGAASLTNLPGTWVRDDLAEVNVHPTAAGYRVYTSAVIAASGYRLGHRRACRVC